MYNKKLASLFAFTVWQQKQPQTHVLSTSDLRQEHERNFFFIQLRMHIEKC